MARFQNLMDSKTVQQQVPIGANVVFFLKTGQAFSGVLTELTRDHVTIESLGKKVTILLEMIGVCQVEDQPETEVENNEFNKLGLNAISDGLVSEVRPALLQPVAVNETETNASDIPSSIRLAVVPV